MEQNSKTWLWVVAAVVALAVLGGWLWQSNQAVAPATSETAGPALSVGDTAAVVDQELNATDLGNFEKELKTTEADLNTL